MHLLAVVLEQLVLLGIVQSSQRLRHIAARILGAHHETNLAARVGGNRRPSILGNGEDRLAVLLQLLDDAQM